MRGEPECAGDALVTAQLDFTQHTSFRLRAFPVLVIISPVQSMFERANSKIATWLRLLNTCMIMNLLAAEPACHVAQKLAQIFSILTHK